MAIFPKCRYARTWLLRCLLWFLIAMPPSNPASPSVLGRLRQSPVLLQLCSQTHSLGRGRPAPGKRWLLPLHWHDIPTFRLDSLALSVTAGLSLLCAFPHGLFTLHFAHQTLDVTNYSPAHMAFSTARLLWEAACLLPPLPDFGKWDQAPR